MHANRPTAEPTCGICHPCRPEDIDPHTTVYRCPEHQRVFDEHVAPLLTKMLHDLTVSTRWPTVSTDPIKSLADLDRLIADRRQQAPHPARINVSERVLAGLRSYVPRRQPEPWQPAAHDPFGIPIVVDPVLPDGSWQVVGQDGEVLREGTVAP